MSTDAVEQLTRRHNAAFAKAREVVGILAEVRAEVEQLRADLSNLTNVATLTAAALERVRALHSPEPGWQRQWKNPADALARGWPICAGCGPDVIRSIGKCPTLRALAAVSTPDGTEREVGQGSRRCPNCAPGYDCERGIYEPAGDGTGSDG